MSAIFILLTVTGKIMRPSTFIGKFFRKTKGNVFLCSYANDPADKKKFPPLTLVSSDGAIDIAAIDKFVKDCDLPGCAVYFAVNTVRGKVRNKNEIAEIVARHIDIDFSGVVESESVIRTRLKQLELKPSIVIASGNGLHCYWMYEQPLDPGQIASHEDALQRLCDLFAGDRAAAEAARVLRLPGSHNSKHGKWHLVDVVAGLSTWKTYSASAMDRWMQDAEPFLTRRVVERPVTSSNPFLDYAKEMRTYGVGTDLQSMLEGMEYKGTNGNSINEVRVHVVGSMAASGATLQEVIDVLLPASKHAFMTSPHGSGQWSDRKEIKLITDKYRWVLRRDAQKEQQASEDSGEPEEAKKEKTGKKVNGHDLHDVKPPKHIFDYDPPPADNRGKSSTPSAEALQAWGKPNTDLFTAFVVPQMKPEYLPELIANIAFSNAASMNGDPGALAMSLMTAASAMIATDIKIKVKAQEHNTWLESARVWTVLIGEPGSTKSPLMRAAIKPITDLDFKLGKQFNEMHAEYQAMDKEEKAQTDKPVRRTYILNNISIEAGADTLFDNPQGVLFFSDEFRALLGTATKYVNKSNRGAEHTSKAFLLSAYNSEYAKVTRIGRAEKYGYPSISMLGSIQPDLLHQMAAAAEDNDGFLQRTTPVFICETVLGENSDEDPKYPFQLFHELIDRLYNSPLQHGATIRFSVRGQIWMDHMLDYCRVQHNYNLALYPPLAAAYRKMEAMYARWCLIYHMIENPSSPHAGAISETVARKVFVFMQNYVEPHIIQLHRMSSLNDEHKNLRAIVLYALSHNLNTLIARDLQRGSKQLNQISGNDMRRFMEKLEAMNYGRILARGKNHQYNSLAFKMNPNVAIELKDQTVKEQERLEKARREIAALKAKKQLLEQEAKH